MSPPDKARTVVYVVVGLLALLALAYVLSHERVRALEQRLGAMAMSFGARRGAARTGAEPAVVRWTFAGLLPQAGLALALLLPRVFPAFGSAAAALVVGVVALNELIMPVVLRQALVQCGEARQVHHAPTSSSSLEEPES